MNAYLLDTDVVINFLNKKPPHEQLIPQLADRGILYLSILSIAELRAGWSKEKAAVFLPDVYDLFVVADMTRDIAECAGELRNRYKKQGIQLHVVDAIIAATAISNGYQLLTGNRKDFPMPELKLYEEKAA